MVLSSTYISSFAAYHDLEFSIKHGIHILILQAFAHQLMKVTILYAMIGFTFFKNLMKGRRAAAHV